MASFVYDKGANLTLKALLAESPDEILAVRTERGLLEEARNEVMILDIIDVLLLERTFSATVTHGEFVVALRHLVHDVVLVGHGWAGLVLTRARVQRKSKELANSSRRGTLKKIPPRVFLPPSHTHTMLMLCVFPR